MFFLKEFIVGQIFTVDENFDHALFENASCAFGVFDGVHLGHQYLISCAKETAAEHGGLSIALTFDRDPDELFNADGLKKLMSNPARVSALSRTGVDAVVVLPFTKEFASLSPQKFLETTFNGHATSNLHVGIDFRFGSHASGTVNDLGIWGAHSGTHINAHNLQVALGEPITATRIRGLLAKHDLEKASELLGHRYSIIEQIQPGRGEGEDMGFATANIVMPKNRQVLSEGVYSAYAIVDGVRYRAAVSVGVSPVFADQTNATCEVHILDFSGNIYGEWIEVEFMEFLRPMIKFDSTEELIRTVMNNIEYTRNTLPLN